MKPLFHFTAPFESHLGSILTEGEIRTTESNCSPHELHAGPDVVWLTDDPEPDAQAGWCGEDSAAKQTCVLEVRVSDARPWSDWADEHDVVEWWRESLEKNCRPDTWYVCERPIRHYEIRWLAFHHPDDGSFRAFEGEDLRRLFESRGRQRALALPRATIFKAEPVLVSHDALDAAEEFLRGLGRPQKEGPPVGSPSVIRNS